MSTQEAGGEPRHGSVIREKTQSEVAIDDQPRLLAGLRAERPGL